MCKRQVRTRVLRCLVIEIALLSFSDALTSAFIAIFNMQYLQVHVGSKTCLQQFVSGVRILDNYQIYLISCFDSRNINDNLKNKTLHQILQSNPNGLLITNIKCLFMRNGIILTLHIIPNRKLQTISFQMAYDVVVCIVGTLSSGNKRFFFYFGRSTSGVT